MEKFIDKLKQDNSLRLNEELKTATEKEKLSIENPFVVCGVTMGKEPHIGHLFLIAVADQIKCGLGSKLPLFVVNNNTGPRPAGALVSMAEKLDKSLSETAQIMSQGRVYPKDIVTSYKQRSESEEKVNKAMSVLDNGDLDIFSVIALETEKVLRDGGFELKVVSESKLLQSSKEKIVKINDRWIGSGFAPFVGDKRVVVVQKGGRLTATGVFLSSIREITDRTKADLAVVVDGHQGVGDVTYVHTEIEAAGIGSQVLGSGVALDGKIASGTKGEAVTIKELFSQFLNMRPNGNLKKASSYLTLTRPVYLPNGSDRSLRIYNFENNDRALMELVKCEDELANFKEGIADVFEDLLKKIGSETKTDDKELVNFLRFLPKKLEAVIKGEPDRVLSESKKLINGVRQNYYFNVLRSAVLGATKVNEITMDDYLMLVELVERTIIRVGI